MGTKKCGDLGSRNDDAKPVPRSEKRRVESKERATLRNRTTTATTSGKLDVELVQRGGAQALHVMTPEAILAPSPPRRITLALGAVSHSVGA